jgi:glycosyltransferase involved in cell wall biosynthesis
MDKKIKILIYPLDSRNPYQKLLSQWLQKNHECTVYLKPRAYKSFPFHLISACRAYDVIHLHWIWGLYEAKTRTRMIIKSISVCITLLIIRLLHKNVVLTLHNLLRHDSAFPACELWSRKIIIKAVNRVIVHSNPSKEIAIQKFGSRKKFHVIPHGDFRRVYPNSVSKTEARAFLNIPEKKKVLLFFGILRPYKGLENLLLASRFIDQNVLLLIAGSGDDDYIKKLQDMANQNVILHSEYIPSENVQYYMNASDCMILPYRESFTSGVAVLSLGFYLPIICTKCTAFQHLVERELCIGFDSLKPDSITKALDTVCSWDKEVFRERCNAFLHDSSWENVSQAHAAVYSGKVNDFPPEYHRYVMSCGN